MVDARNTEKYYFTLPVTLQLRRTVTHQKILNSAKEAAIKFGKRGTEPGDSREGEAETSLIATVETVLVKYG